MTQSSKDPQRPEVIEAARRVAARAAYSLFTEVALTTFCISPSIGPQAVENWLDRGEPEDLAVVDAVLRTLTDMPREDCNRMAVTSLQALLERRRVTDKLPSYQAFVRAFAGGAGGATDGKDPDR
jgi:hypothetical protein